MNNPLEGMDYTPEDISKVSGEVAKLPHNAGICVCGHSYNSHTENVPPGYNKAHDHARATRKPICKPSKHTCPCREYKQVLTTSDSRVFRRTTIGPGTGHALTRGIILGMEKGVEINWDRGLECVRCHTPKEEIPLASVAYDLLWFEAKQPTDMNVLICKDCRDTIEYEWAGIPEKQRPDKSKL